MPWYVHALVLLGSFFGMLLLLGIIVLGKVYKSPSALAVLGLSMMGAAVFFRIGGHIKGSQIFQATLLVAIGAGQCIFYYYMIEELDITEDSMLFVFVLIQIGLFIFYPDSLYRILAMPLVVFGLHGYAEDHFPDLAPTMLTTLFLFCFCLVFLVRSERLQKFWLARAAYQGLLPTLLAILVDYSAEETGLWQLWFVYVCLIGAVTALYFTFLRHTKLNGVALGVTLLGWLLAVGLSWSTPATTISLIVASVAYLSAEQRSPRLNLFTIIVCALGFLVYLFQYYYLLDLSLLAKSLRLILAGVALLAYAGLAYALRDNMSAGESGNA